MSSSRISRIPPPSRRSPRASGGARPLLALGLAFSLSAAALGACSTLKAGEEGAADGATDSPTAPTGTGTGTELLPDGALPDGATPPPDAEPDAEPDASAKSDAWITQFDGGAVPKPTCVGPNSESWVPEPACVPGASCFFSKVTRSCKNGSCADGYCQELDWVAESPKATPGTIYAVWGAAPDAIWAVGDGVFFFNGSTWAPVDIGVTFDNFTQAFAVAGLTREDVTILVGNHTTGPMFLRRRDATGVWRPVAQLNNGGVWGGGLFALGNNRFLVHQGSDGVYLATPTAVNRLGYLYGFPAGHHYTNALSGFKANDVMVASAGGQGAFFYDGFELKSFAGWPAHAVLAVPDATALMSVGSKINIFNASGGRVGGEVNLYTESGTTDGYWRGIDGTGLNRMWVVGSKGIVLRRSATGWAPESIPTPSGMIAAWATPWGDVYTTGGKLWHGK
ncbi:MAG: hypothetical protein IPF92_27390 [Myxococcales bacterium]|nr:hypothetical protein [Myxococcales bacterium]